MKTISHKARVSASFHKLKADTKAYRRDGYRYKVEVTTETEDKPKKRTRRHFKEKDKALAYELEINDAAGALRPEDTAILSDNDQLEEASRCLKLLAPTGKSLTDAVQHFLEYYRRNEQLEVVTVSDAAILYYEGKESGVLNKERKKLKTRSLETIRDTISHGRTSFASMFGDESMGELQKKDFMEWVGEPESPTTVSKRFTYLNGFLNTAIKQRWILENPLDRDDKPSPNAAKEFFEAEKVAILMSLCEDDILAYVALGFFAGLRSSEILELDWRDILFDEKEIVVMGSANRERGGSVKGGDANRIVTLRSNLREWLLPLAEERGPVVKKNFRKRFEAAREEAGMMEEWPHNVARNSFCTHLAALFRSDADASREAGHADVRTFAKHYRKNLPKSHGEVYFGITPQEVENVVSISA